MATTAAAATPVSAPAASAQGRHLFGALTDFLLLGGASLCLFPLLAVLPSDPAFVAAFGSATVLAANLINHPHFVHSYQIFYRDYRQKAFSDALGRPMRQRYLFAGLVAPLLLAAALLGALLGGHPRALGLAGNLMALTVGWHYVKQGYGMAMVDAALKRRYFSDREKTALLANGYALWIAAWLHGNQMIAERSLGGVRYFTFAVPAPLLWLSLGVAATTLLWLLVRLFERHQAGKPIAWTGLCAYLVSLYAWIGFVWVNPYWVLLTPVLHSLQYLAIVWRYQGRLEAAADPAALAHDPSPLRRATAARPGARLMLFIASGTLLGAATFWMLPVVLDLLVPYDHHLFGDSAFLFVIWIFINIHHYFLDNVMWRRENPDVARHLFG